MNNRKTNILFLIILTCYVGGSIWISFYSDLFSGNYAVLLLVSQALVFVPAFICYLIFRGATKRKQRQLQEEEVSRMPATAKMGILKIKKVRISTLFMSVLYMVLCMPIVTLVNGISMMFTDNKVADISPYVTQLPFLLIFLIMAVIGPFNEEFVFRGMIFQGYRRQGNVFMAIIMSSLLFGFMHLNFNQASYAFVLGIFMALLVEATNNYLVSFLMHLLFNANSVCLMYLTASLPLNTMNLQGSPYYASLEWAYALSVYVYFAVIATPIAFCVLAWIAKNEGRTERMKRIWPSRKIKLKHYLTPLFLVVVILCIGLTIWFN
ncbi:CPBP family intramembrane metalloprotease [Lachnospiraceae bacterium OttesenSCG-928-D06]|nr:CPBP family intramembrane metalloprotease [Lachnospiraceae bacterium OttesenSCG-928-D06]